MLVPTPVLQQRLGRSRFNATQHVLALVLLGKNTRFTPGSATVADSEMTQGRQLTQRSRTAIKLGICLVLIVQVLANAYLLYVHKKLVPIPTDPRMVMLLIPGFIYLMGTKVPEILTTSAGIRRQAFHLADWWFAFAIWQFVAYIGTGPIIVLFVVGALKIALSIKDVILVQA
jgi:hypothetical protein